MDDISTLDWNEAWKEITLKKHSKVQFGSCVERWSDPERCRKFNRKVQEDNWKTARERIQAMKITPSSRVLDIGAGPGTLAIPLSEIVRHVTAIEPSAGMLACLHDNMHQRDIKNITLVQKKWEDVDPVMDLDAPYDIVVASYSLGVPDLRAALEKMDKVSGKYAYIFWFADMMSPRHRHYLEIWPDLFRVPAAPRHMPNIIFNMLNQMGIFANVEVTRTEHVTRFSSMEEAIADQGDALHLTEERQVLVLKKFLEKKLVQEDGQYILKGRANQAKIWWEKEN
jgi:ubiquinone/menaquinone biosynthesis C-methylase UbiE